MSLLRNDTGHSLVALGMGNRTMFPAQGLFGGGDGTLRVHAIDGQSVHAKGCTDVAQGYVSRQATADSYGCPADARNELGV